MTSDLFAEKLRPVEDLHALLHRHGLMRTLLALPVALLKPRKVRHLRDHGLSPHLLRDIGIVPDLGPRPHSEMR